MKTENSWKEKLKPILGKYEGKSHPLEYQNLYQLMIMVILSAQDSDANINRISPALFRAFPNFQSLSASNANKLIPYISKVKNFGIKANWIIEIAQQLKNEQSIPNNMQDLIALKRHW